MSEILQPQYIAKFHCTGPECQDTCCRDWTVPIDKETYNHYRSCPNKSLKDQLNKHVTQNHSNPSDFYYAKMKMDSERFCPMLDSEKLCSLQRALGEKYLSITCNSYPRIGNMVNGVLEVSLTMSCPDAARLALLNPNRMEFDFSPNTYPRVVVAREVNFDHFSLKNKVEEHFWPLRIFTISLLQNRSYPLWQRLVILGFFCQKVNNASPADVLDIIAQYNDAIERGDFCGELDSLPTRYDIQGGLLSLLLTLKADSATEKFAGLISKAKMSSGLKDQMETVEFAAYQHAYETHYRPFMEEREHILENYLVNYVFINLFPFQKRGVFDSYVMLVIHYAAIKMLLIGLAAHYQEEFTDDHIIELIYSFSRNIEHDVPFLNNIHSLFEGNEWTNMPYMALLLRN